MEIKGNLYFLVFLPAMVSFLTSFLSTPLVIKLAYKIGIIDDPKKNRHPKVIHTYPVPRGGGLSIFFSLVITSLLFLPFDKHLLGILSGALILSVMGLLDDKYNLNPYFRLVIQFMAASIPIAAGIGIAFINSPLGGILDLSNPKINIFFLGEQRSIWILADLFALFWIVALMNFLNMGAKGIDGQLPGVSAIAAATIGALSLKYSADITQWPVTILAVITSGAFLGFLPWNVFPQKIMPSFLGSNLAGYLLGILSILSTAKVGTLMVVLGIPLVDTGYTITRRLLSGKSPVWGDRGHLHHKLLDAGWSKRKISFFYWGVTAILGLIALNLNASYKLYTIVGVFVFVGGALLWLTYRQKMK
ncbi:undecaprenyl/decaprenyl-phosphate alpha-N-acetylglucosaminyl 1-phosphate transferase [Patescibacteria group bacterium]|nr:undecaprenyl/decaprenyl-phosphate alpha-N-acetylglucosaminyl 1-phosphate transferase [Patescibacteria group bacterium]